MFTRGRYVVVDDNESELNALVAALHACRIPCVPILYMADQVLADGFLAGVRVLFLDLHLVPSVQLGDHAPAINNLIQLLETGITAESGPYVVVLWSSHAGQHAELSRKIGERLDPTKRPLAVLVLDKKTYDLDKPTAESGAKLIEDVSAEVAKDPRLQALVNWERSVLNAASATLSHLGSLIPDAEKTPEKYGPRIDTILSELAAAAVGKQHVKSDIKAAVNAALAPILADQIANQRSEPDDTRIWEAAVTKYEGKPSLAPAEAARLNTMLHVAMAPAENPAPTDWGALVLPSEAALTDESISGRFGLAKKGSLLFEASPAKRGTPRYDDCNLAFVRIGASCDHAQKRSGPMLYALAFIVPSSAVLRDPMPMSFVSSPLLILPSADEPVCIYVNARFQISLTENDVASWQTLGRIREQLLMKITAHCAEYTTRPGIISIPALDVPLAKLGESENRLEGIIPGGKIDEITTE
jgi:hypothetical protein